MSNCDYSRRRLQGWGFVGDEPTAAEAGALVELVRGRFPQVDAAPRPAVALADVELAPARLEPPPTLAAICSTDKRTRCLHAVGRSFVDLVRARAGRFEPAPDVVAAPRDAAEVEAVLAWCAEQEAACVPFGGGTSVVGGVNPPGDRPVVTLNTRAMGRVRELDLTSRAALVEAGASGPVLEDQLRRHGLTLRFYPQSFELSTLGGWIATRAGGHYATRLTHIDDVVEAISAVTPAGRWDSRRLPASGAGPSPDRVLLGSEGILGVITEAWVRLQRRPQHRTTTSVLFRDLPEGGRAVRALVQAGLDPANCRLLDPIEAALNGAGDGSAAVLVVGFESAEQSVDGLLATALELCRDHGGRAVGPPAPGGKAADAGAGQVVDDHARAAADPAAVWRRSFLRAPYLRDVLIGLGMVVETVETAVTWDRFEPAHAAITAAIEAAMHEACGDGLVTCRTTHTYPDGIALYLTVIAPGRHGSQAEQWTDVKSAASEAILAAGGTITHHHAVGRDHRPWYDRQRPEPFARGLAAAKQALDPAGVLNPGVLLDAPPAAAPA